MILLSDRIAKNASWIIVSKLMQSVLAFIINLFTARYLGPSNYGLINYAASIVAFVLPIAQLGFNNTLVQELTQDFKNEGRVLGTTICLSIISAFTCMVGVISFVAAANIGDTETVLIVAIYSLNLLFQVMDLIQYWFQSKLLSKHSSIVSLIAYSIVSGYKLFLLIAQKSVYWFAASQAIDYFIIAVFLMIIYHKLGGQKLSFDFSLGKRMFAKSKHYILTGMMISIFSQTDKIMLKSMIGEAVTGYYSAAVAIASATGFVYAAIIDSFRPVIFSAEGNKEQFELYLKRLYCIVIWLSLLQSLVMTLLSDVLINLLYGAEYAESANMLRIVVWYITFSYFGSVRNIWILSKNKQKYLFAINALGAFANVVLNLFLIRLFGGIGAAISSFFTQFFTNFILGFILPPIRENNAIIMRSINPKLLFDLIKKRT